MMHNLLKKCQDCGKADLWSLGYSCKLEISTHLTPLSESKDATNFEEINTITLHGQIEYACLLAGFPKSVNPQGSESEMFLAVHCCFSPNVALQVDGPAQAHYKKLLYTARLLQR